MPLRTKIVLVLEPAIMVALVIYLLYTDQPLLILLAVFLALGPITAFWQDRKIRPTRIIIDNNGVTPYIGKKEDILIPWSLVVLIPRRRGGQGAPSGILVQEGKRMPMLVSDDIFGALVDAFRKRNGKEPY